MTVEPCCDGLRVAVPPALCALGLAGPLSTRAKRRTLKAPCLVHVCREALRRWAGQQGQLGAEGAEGRARYNKVRIIGLPEGMEGAQATPFIEEWLSTVASPTGLSTLFTVERVQRGP
ncbi:hypothetical protein NDU88_011882 [Pleurodeles waltl]|uniref:Uncharacterized protein n=1 Tax=Pleurodeles waltl TaxID=8319 RepID=A0AAV7QYK2_PLEWA|nr:hypothetical protein NDU88_011882 [Pleurodeles waltl]